MAPVDPTITMSRRPDSENRAVANLTVDKGATRLSSMSSLQRSGVPVAMPPAIMRPATATMASNSRGLGGLVHAGLQGGQIGDVARDGDCSISKFFRKLVQTPLSPSQHGHRATLTDDGTTRSTPSPLEAPVTSTCRPLRSRVELTDPPPLPSHVDDHPSGGYGENKS